jgi:O-antigen/teichoic acid export membrane protein
LKKKFFTNLTLLVGLNVLIKPFWVFGIDRTVQNVVGAAEYGFYFSLFSFSLLLNILLDLGITNFNNREIARHPHLLRPYFSNIIGIKFLLAIFYGFFVFGIALLLGYDQRQIHLLWVLVLNQFLASFLLYLRSNISGLQKFATDSLLSVLDRMIMILLCSILLWTDVFNHQFKIEWFVYTQTIAYFIALVVAFIIVSAKTRPFKMSFEVAFILKIMKKSYPFALLMVLMSVYYRIDSVMLERMLPGGNVEAGIYAQAFRILDAFTMFAFLFATLLLPMYSRMIRKGIPVEDLTVFSFMILMVPVMIISICLIFYRFEFMELLYHRFTFESARILAVLMIAHIFVSVSYITGTLLTAGGYLKELNLIAGTGLILNVVLNVIFIPQFAAYGSAVASAVTQVLIVLLQMILVYRLFSFKKKSGLILRFSGFSILLIVLGYFSTKLPLPWISKAGILIVLAFLTAYLAGLIKPGVLISLFKSDEEAFLND